MQTTTNILHARSRYHEGQGVGPLSIKTFHGGQAPYRAAGGRHLRLNAGQAYAITVEAAKPVKSFCLFFATGFAAEVAYSLTPPVTQLLDRSNTTLAPTYLFYGVYP